VGVVGKLLVQLPLVSPDFNNIMKITRKITRQGLGFSVSREGASLMVDSFIFLFFLFLFIFFFFLSISKLANVFLMSLLCTFYLIYSFRVPIKNEKKNIERFLNYFPFE
jgi:Ca2+/Na+ antiporter